MICCSMGSHFHDRIDYNGLVIIELLEWVRALSGFWRGEEKILVSRVLKKGGFEVKM